MKFSNGLLLVYVEALEDSSFYEFSDSLNESGIPTIVNSRPNPGPQACIEWLVPTAIIAGVSTGFLNELGKDLYNLVKVRLSDFTSQTMKKPRIEPVILGTEGKIRRDNPFSNAFSIYSDTETDRKFKLLIPKYSAETDYSIIVHAYLDFLNDYSQGLVSETDIGLNTSELRMPNTITVHFNQCTNRIEWIDPLPSHVRNGVSTE